MDKEAMIKKTEEYVKASLDGADSGHDWWHVYRVWKNAVRISENEKEADMFVVQAAALLHDISDYKFNGGDDKEGGRIAGSWLRSIGTAEEDIRHVREIIDGMSFKGAGVAAGMRTLEGKIVQDADRLDAIGAIGIARAFAYGGHAQREMYNPDIRPVMHASFGEYKKSHERGASSPTINHFYEKLLLLKGLMNTTTAKEMAEGRDRFMQEYLKHFYNEWEGRE